MNRFRFYYDGNPNEVLRSTVISIQIKDFEILTDEYDEKGEEIWRKNKNGISLADVMDRLEDNGKEIERFERSRRPVKYNTSRYTAIVKNKKEERVEVKLNGDGETILKRVLKLVGLGGEVTHHSRPCSVNGFTRDVTILIEPKDYSKYRAWLIDNKPPEPAWVEPEEPIWVREGYPSNEYWKWT